MPLFLAILVTVLLTIVAFAFLSIWAFFVVIPVVLALIAYVALARRSDDPRAGTIEREHREPTGTPRKARGGAQTANERVGQA